MKILGVSSQRLATLILTTKFEIIDILKEQLSAALSHNLIGQPINLPAIKQQIERQFQSSLPAGCRGKIKDICTTSWGDISVLSEIQTSDYLSEKITIGEEKEPFLMANYLFQDHIHGDIITVEASILIK